MIQAILSYQFVLKPGEDNILEPEFEPLKLVFDNSDFSEEDYSELINNMDIFAIFYQHTTGIAIESKAFSNYYVGRLKNTPYQVISQYRQDTYENQFITIAVFELEDELELFEELFRTMGQKLEILYEELMIKKSVKNYEKVESEFKFIIFQISRLIELDKLQKAALIFQSEERLRILELLRERPISKNELKAILERIKPNPNVDLLIRPFLELNLIRRDWIKGITRKKEIDMSFQGEYLFLIKDITLARFPSNDLIERIKEFKREGYKEYEEKLVEFFSNYDVNKQSKKELMELASALLIPDVFDFYSLMTKSYYPLDKLPRVFSEFVDTKFVVDTLLNLNVITTIKDKDERPWVLLFTEVKPLTSFPEYLVLKIKDSYLSKTRKNKISFEIAKKALELLEGTYQEKVKF
jgi:hypothetical protein